jgi:hypothetical protein
VSGLRASAARQDPDRQCSDATRRDRYSHRQCAIAKHLADSDAAHGGNALLQKSDQ